MIYYQGQHGTRYYQEFNSKRVRVAVISGSKLDKHQINSSQRCADEDNLHHRVVEADKGGEQVKIAREIGDGE